MNNLRDSKRLEIIPPKKRFEITNIAHVINFIIQSYEGWMIHNKTNKNKYKKTNLLIILDRTSEDVKVKGVADVEDKPPADVEGLADVEDIDRTAANVEGVADVEDIDGKDSR